MLSYVGDEKALCQLVEILIDNALKYSREGDTVHLTLERQGRFIRMAVENGVENMDKDVVDNMFDRFYRADRARASDGGGHGIGLSIAQAVVSAHPGKDLCRRQCRPADDDRALACGLICCKKQRPLPDHAGNGRFSRSL